MNFDLRFYWALFLRRLPVMMMLALLVSGLGIAYALRLPDTYSTEARLLVEAPKIPETMVFSTVQTEAEEQLQIIEQKLLTRANLIDIARKFQVFPDLANMEPDEIVEAMQKQTRITRSAGRNLATLMTISFEARTPRTAADVVNEYVTLVLEENVDFRMSRAEGTLQFFQQEVERLGQDLDRQSAAIATFKSENSAALPEDQSYRLGRLTLLQERLTGLERDRKDLVTQREEIVRIFESTGSIRSGLDQEQDLSPEEKQLIAARRDLENAKSVYSDTNPKMVRLQSLVDRLEKIVLEQNQDSASGDGQNVTGEQALLQATLAQVDTRIASLDDQIADATEEIEALQAAIAKSAANGIQLAALERDYDAIQSRYNGAVDNLNEAQMSERVETTSQGQRISVIENASIPQLPSGPERIKIAILAVGAGAGLAAGYFMLLETLNRNIRSPAELTGRFDITPITTIPYMESQREKFLRRTGLVTATLAVLIIVPAALWYVDTFYLPLELLVEKGLDQIGLG